MAIRLAPDGTRAAILTLGPAIVANAAPLAGDLARVTERVKCQSDLEVRDGALRPITKQPRACNR